MILSKPRTCFDQRRSVFVFDVARQEKHQRLGGGVIDQMQQRGEYA